MMAARFALPVSEVLFLFFTARGGSFLSQKEKEKNGGASPFGVPKRKRAPLQVTDDSIDKSDRREILAQMKV